MAKRGSAHIGHDWREEEENALPVFFHVRLGQLDADGKDTNGKYNTGDFQCDCVDNGMVAVPPATRIKYSGAMRAYERRWREGRR